MKKLPQLAAIGVIGIGVALPFILDVYWTERVVSWIPLMLAALGLNLLTGFNGQISVGHSAFFGAGAYAAALSLKAWQVPFLVSVVVAAAVCFVLGVIVGLPALRIKGLYLALVTLAVGMLFPQILEQMHSVTGGNTGLSITSPEMRRGELIEAPIKFETPSFLKDVLEADQWTYFCFLAVVIVSTLLVRNLVHSRIGRAMIAIRDNEVAAETAGVPVARVKVITFGISSALAGVGGALLALDNAKVFSTSFSVNASLFMLVAVMVGGPATVLGPIIGAVVVGFFDDVVRKEWLGESAGAASPLILGIMLIGLMYFAPGGVAGSLKQALGRRALRRA